MTQIFFDGEYQGPRWTYGLQYRPLDFAQVPNGWIIQSDQEHPDFAFGTVDYPVKLTDTQVQRFDLVLVKTDPGTDKSPECPFCDSEETEFDKGGYYFCGNCLNYFVGKWVTNDPQFPTHPSP